MPVASISRLGHNFAQFIRHHRSRNHPGAAVSAPGTGDAKTVGQTLPETRPGLAFANSSGGPVLAAEPQQTDAPLAVSADDRLQALADEVQKTGGVLSDHAVKLARFATEEKICICIRAVNPLATGLIASGLFGTKDMSIKAKSSNLPPLSGLIPYDQKYGKKGNNPSEVKKFNHKNEAAIRDGIATKVDAKISLDRLAMLHEATGRLGIRRDVLGLEPGQLLLSGNDFRSEGFGSGSSQGQNFHFIADPDPAMKGEYTIYPAKQDRLHRWEKDTQPVQVMANRQGKAVTADYDLALVAPRLADLTPEHMSSLKMTSFEEVAARTGIVHRFQGQVADAVGEFARACREFGAAPEATGLSPALAGEVLKARLERLLPGDFFVTDGTSPFAAPKVGLDPSMRALRTQDWGKLATLAVPPELAESVGLIAARHDFYDKAVPEALGRTQVRYAPSKEMFEFSERIIDKALASPADAPMKLDNFLRMLEAERKAGALAEPLYQSIRTNLKKIQDSAPYIISDIAAAGAGQPRVARNAFLAASTAPALDPLDKAGFVRLLETAFDVDLRDRKFQLAYDKFPNLELSDISMISYAIALRTAGGEVMGVNTADIETASNQILDLLAPKIRDLKLFTDTFRDLIGTDLLLEPEYIHIADCFPDLKPEQRTFLSNVLGTRLEGTPFHEMGIASRYILGLLPKLNRELGRTDGLEVFHHGPDSGNPYSVEADNFPMTVILPDKCNFSGAGDKQLIRIVKDSVEFEHLAYELANQGFMVAENYMWNKDQNLFSVRPEWFTHAREVAAGRQDDLVRPIAEVRFHKV